MIRSALLATLRGVAHGHTERCDGPLGPRGAPGVHGNRTRVAAAIGGDGASLVVPEQVHGATVAIVGAAQRGSGHGTGDGDAALPAIPRTDGLVTAERGVPLLSQGADCPLIALADPEARVVAAIHSGWRGTVARIASRGVAAACEVGASAAGLRAAVFPGIGPCCFEVGPDVAHAFAAAFGAESSAWFTPRGDGSDRLLCDVRAAIVATLRAEGVPRDAIDVVPGCTACGGNLWSHRASRGGPERHGLVIALV